MQKKLLLGGILTVLTTSLFSATIYVTETGSGTMDGSSWGNAYPGTQLQNAIDIGILGDEVWVACGTYYPSSSNDRNASFNMRSGISIYGNFQGTETQLNQRNLACDPCSILSGEIGNAGIEDNSYTVVRNVGLDLSALLDGFTIQGGNDDRSPTSFGDGLGGGIYNHAFGGGTCSPTIQNCLIRNNRAAWGGGIFNNGYNNGNSHPLIQNCLIENNHATIEGGGMDNYGVGGNASPTLINVVFYGNTAATNVGGFYNWGGNANGNSNTTLINCVFVNNHAQNGYAGAIIADNLDEDGQNASGISNLTLKNCIFWGNTATGEGQQFYVRGTATFNATYSNIDLSGQNNPHVIAGPGTGNINQNPMFVNINNPRGEDNCWFTQDDGLAIQTGSPCIDAGDNANVHSTDILGNTRIYGTQVDMGSYEYSPPVYKVSLTSMPTINIFPNPSEGIFYLQTQLKGMVSIRVCDIQAQIVYSKTGFIDAIRSLNLSALPNGIYFIEVGNEQDSYSKKIAKY